MFNIFRTNLAYAVGSMAQSAALFLLIPYLVNALSPYEYGAWSLFEIGILFLTMLVLSGMDVGLMREYWYLDDEWQRRRLSGTILFGVLIWGGFVTLLVSGILWVLKSSFVNIEGLQIEFALHSLLLTTSIGFTEAIFAFLSSLLRIREEAVRFVILSVGRMLIFLGSAITGVQLGYGVDGALVGRLLASLIGIIVAIGFTKSYLAVAFDLKALRRVVRYGLPLLPTNFASYVLLGSDRYVLSSYSTLEAVGIYSFTYRIATSLNILVTRPFALDWAPRRFKIASEPDSEKKYIQALLIYLCIAASFGLLIMASILAVYVLFIPSIYWQGIKVLPIILAAYLVYGLSYPLNVGIMLKDRTEYLPYISWFSAIVCLGLNFWWIPIYGMQGAAWATLVSYILWTGSIAIISLKLYPIAYPTHSLLVILGAIIVGYGGIITFDQWWITIPQWWNIQSLFLALLIKGIWLLTVIGSVVYLLWGQQLKQLSVLAQLKQRIMRNKND